MKPGWDFTGAEAARGLQRDACPFAAGELLFSSISGLMGAFALGATSGAQTHARALLCPPSPCFMGYRAHHKNFLKVSPFSDVFAARVLHTSGPLLVGMGLTQHFPFPMWFFVTAEKRERIESPLVAAGLPFPSPASRPQPCSPLAPQVSPGDNTWDGDYGGGSYLGPVEGWIQCSPCILGPWGIPGLGHGRCSEITSAGCVLTSDFSFWAKVIKTGE